MGPLEWQTSMRECPRHLLGWNIFGWKSPPKGSSGTPGLRFLLLVSVLPTVGGREGAVWTPSSPGTVLPGGGRGMVWTPGSPGTALDLQARVRRFSMALPTANYGALKKESQPLNVGFFTPKVRVIWLTGKWCNGQESGIDQSPLVPQTSQRPAVSDSPWAPWRSHRLNKQGHPQILVWNDFAVCRGLLLPQTWRGESSKEVWRAQHSSPGPGVLEPSQLANVPSLHGWLD